MGAAATPLPYEFQHSLMNDVHGAVIKWLFLPRIAELTSGLNVQPCNAAPVVRQPQLVCFVCNARIALYRVPLLPALESPPTDVGGDTRHMFKVTFDELPFW